MTEVYANSGEQCVEQMRFVSRILELRLRIPFSVASWIRTVERNREVGGHVRSLHLYGLAMDVVPGSGVSSSRLLSEAKALDLHGIVEPDHVHLQARMAQK